MEVVVSIYTIHFIKFKSIIKLLVYVIIYSILDSIYVLSIKLHFY
jgi:hypothetical protein